MARASLILAVLLTVVFAVAGAVVRPSMYSDSGFGFRVWDSMRGGAGFNRLVQPLHTNIALDVSDFSTWWTPGQYFFPGVLELTGMDLGIAIVVVVTVASAFGLWGWYALYRAFGFSARIAAISLAVIACGRHYGLPFGVYNGGEVLLFAGIPWAYLLVWRLRDLPWRIVPAFILATAGVVFLKLSGILFMGGALAAAVLSGGQPWFSRETMRRAAVAAVALGLTAAVFHYGWLSRGGTAVGGVEGVDLSGLGHIVAFTISGIWSGIFSFGSLIDYAVFFPGRELLSSRTALDYLLLLPAGATALFVWWRVRATHPAYGRFAVLATGAVAAVFVVTWLRGGAVSFDERHFRPLSLLLLVGLVEAFLGGRSRVAKALFLGAAGLSALYGLASYGQHLKTDLHDALGKRGVRLHIVTAPPLAYLATIDHADADGTRPVVYVPTPEVGLELRRSRLIVTHADFESGELLASRVYRGRVRRLYVLLQASLVDNGKADIILKSFADYSKEDWKKTTLGDFVVFSSTP